MTEAIYSKLRLTDAADSLECALEVAEYLIIQKPCDHGMGNLCDLRHIGALVTICRMAAHNLTDALEELSVEGDTP